MIYLEAYSTGTVSCNSEKLYSLELRKKVPELRKKIVAPILSFLIKTPERNILIGTGTNDMQPFGKDLCGRILSAVYNIDPNPSIARQLRKSGIEEIGAVILKSLKRTETSGIPSLNGLLNGEIYAPREEIEAVDKNGIGGWTKERLIYSSEVRGMVKKGKIRTLEELPFRLELINLSGKSCGKQIGVRLGNLALVGMAMETPYSLVDPNPPSFFHEDKIAQGKTYQKLRELANQGILLLSTHDPAIKPTNGEDFFNSKQYENLLKRQQHILKTFSQEPSI